MPPAASATAADADCERVNQATELRPVENHLAGLAGLHDFVELGRVAHRFKSGNAQIGAVDLAARCDRLIRAARAGNSGQCLATLRTLEQGYRELVPELNRLGLQAENTALSEPTA